MNKINKILITIAVIVIVVLLFLYSLGKYYQNKQLRDLGLSNSEIKELREISKEIKNLN